MFDFVYAFLAVLFYGSVSTFSKFNIKNLGRPKALVYISLFLVCFLILSAFILQIPLNLPKELIPLYIFQIIVGASISLVHFKTLENGHVAAISPITRTSVLLVVLTSIFFLNESISLVQMAGATIIVLSAFIISDRFDLRKKWFRLALITVMLRTIYFTTLKIFVSEIGPLSALVLLESGNAILIVLYNLWKGKDIRMTKDIRYAAIPALLIVLGALFYNFSVSTIGAGLTAAISGSIPVVGAILSFIVLREKLAFKKYVAIMFLVLGIVLLFL